MAEHERPLAGALLVMDGDAGHQIAIAEVADEAAGVGDERLSRRIA